MIEGVRKRASRFVGDSILRKIDRVLNMGDDMVVCFPAAKIEAIRDIEIAGEWQLTLTIN